MNRNAHPTLAPLWAAALLAAGCGRETVAHYRVAKPVASAAGPGARGWMAQAMPSATPSAGAPAAGSEGSAAADTADLPDPERPEAGLRWTLPKGWTEAAAGGMRFATLKPPVKGRVEVSVVVLPGEAGGEGANVNRWRGQLGLAAYDEPALAKARKSVGTKAGPFALYDFTSEGDKQSRMVAALAVLDGRTWFLKLLGDAPAVAAARPDFVRLLEGLHVD